MATSAHMVLDTNETEAIWFLGTLARIRVALATTLGVFDMVEFLHPHGFATPLHIHHNADEVFLVLEGTMRGVCDDQEWTANAGATVWLPQGSVHGYAAVGDVPLRSLAMTIPGSFSAFVREAGTAALQPILPPQTMEIDIARVDEIAARYGITHVGPPVSHLADSIWESA